MTYEWKMRNWPLWWVHYRGTSNGAFIRASTAHAAKLAYAEGEALTSLTYLKATKWAGSLNP
jgi:hypothetical protein